MHSPRFQSITARFSPHAIRTSFRRSSSASSRASSDRSSYVSAMSLSPVITSSVNSVVFRQQSMLDLAEERKTFASELDILEPRPAMYWGSMEEAMGSL
jgi:hypothetical protein